MSFEVDEDILQDFLVEAGEILELLSEQLVELENNPENTDLLNAIFRGFHTVKGGAGFLSMTELVDACHGAENIFDVLRQGKRSVTPELMDVILQALDTINEMFAKIQNREQPDPASPELLETLHKLSKPASDNDFVVAPSAPVIEEPVASEPAQDEFDDIFFGADPVDEPEVASDSSGGIDDITEDEFESLLDELHGSGKGPAVVEKQSASNNDDITDDEFESLLDELHGSGSFGAVSADAPKATPAPVSHSKASSQSDEEITEDEFESLLDELHGAGAAPKAVASTPAANPKVETKPQPAAKPAPDRRQNLLRSPQVKRLNQSPRLLLLLQKHQPQNLRHRKLKPLFVLILNV